MKQKNIKKEILAIIPARGGSKRIPKKNIRTFQGKPLIAHTIEHALQCSSIDRVIVDTESEEIAKIAKKYGAEVPFLRPKKLAQDTSDVNENIRYMLDTLREKEGYEPTQLVLLQATSPLREVEDIEKCLTVIHNTKATTVLTVAPTHPILVHLNKKNEVSIVNGSIKTRLKRTQDLPEAYILNGCAVYVVEIDAFFREEKILTMHTRAVVMPKWRSIDLDEIEDWVMAELFFKHRAYMKRRLHVLKGKSQ